MAILHEEAMKSFRSPSSGGKAFKVSGGGGH
jgi:hypothetical protein